MCKEAQIEKLFRTHYYIAFWIIAITFCVGLFMIIYSFLQMPYNLPIHKIQTYKLVIVIGAIITIVSLLLLRSYAKLLFDIAAFYKKKQDDKK